MYTKSMRIMGLDIGKKRIGIALSDQLLITAQPLEVYKRVSQNKDIQYIINLAIENSVHTILLGLPLHMSGQIGDMAEYVLKFKDKLDKYIEENNADIKTETWDERLSTSAVTKTLIEGDVRRENRKKVVDKLAASYILQGFLDYQAHKKTNKKT